LKRSVTANAGKDYTCHVGDAGSSPACLATGSSVMGSTPALRSDVLSNPRRRDATENSRPWRMRVGLHPANEVRRVKRLGNQEMRVRVPPMGRSLRTASRHLSSPRLQGKIAANAGRTTSPCKRQVAGSSPAGSIMGARSSVGRAGGLSKPWSPRTELLKRRECRPGLHSLWYEKVLATFLVPPPNKAGECRWEYIGEGFGLRFESASSHRPSSPAPIRRANAGRTTWESTCAGRRSAVRFRLRATG
jgi:hypothetical protein